MRRGGKGGMPRGSKECHVAERNATWAGKELRGLCGKRERKGKGKERKSEEKGRERERERKRQRD